MAKLCAWMAEESRNSLDLLLRLVNHASMHSTCSHFMQKIFATCPSPIASTGCAEWFHNWGNACSTAITSQARAESCSILCASEISRESVAKRKYDPYLLG